MHNSPRRHHPSPPPSPPSPSPLSSSAPPRMPSDQPPSLHRDPSALPPTFRPSLSYPEPYIGPISDDDVGRSAKGKYRCWAVFIGRRPGIYFTWYVPDIFSFYWSIMSSLTLPHYTGEKLLPRSTVSRMAPRPDIRPTRPASRLIMPRARRGRFGSRVAGAFEYLCTVSCVVSPRVRFVVFDVGSCRPSYFLPCYLLCLLLVCVARRAPFRSYTSVLRAMSL